MKMQCIKKWKQTNKQNKTTTTTKTKTKQKNLAKKKTTKYCKIKIKVSFDQISSFIKYLKKVSNFL